MDVEAKGGGEAKEDAAEVKVAWAGAEAVGNSEPVHGRYNGDNSGHDNARNDAHDSDHGNDGAVAVAQVVCAVKTPMQCTDSIAD